MTWGHWVAGFVDGEGSFNVPIRQGHKRTLHCALVQQGRHLTADGIEHILRLRGPMNRGGKRRYSDEMIIAGLRPENPQRPYAELPL